MTASAPRCDEPGPRARARAGGYSLVEVLMALLLGAILVTGLSEVGGLALSAYETVSEKEALTREARFAMDQMVRTASRSSRLLLPLHDKGWSNWPENLREQTIPASPPIGDSVLATAVLAVTLPVDQDLDGDGWPDADDDRDGRIDEDLYNDVQQDSAPGIWLIDDDGDGYVDENSFYQWDDDESSDYDEDRIDGLDNDDDDNVDEDPGDDMNGDGCAGICGVDDNGDGTVDGGSANDDDEDGASGEDGYNAVVFYLDPSGILMQRIPVPWDETGVGGVTGRDFLARPLAENVTHLRVERLPAAFDELQLLDLTLELTGPTSGERIRLQTRVRVGGAL